MRMILSSVLLLLVAAPAQSQDYQAMMQAMEKAQSEASKPGDDKLSCEQLQEQLIAVTQDPEFQAHVESASASAQRDRAAMNAAAGQTAVQSLRTALMALVPGGAMAGMASAQADAQAQGAQAADRVRSRMDQAKQLTALMPKLMRGQRVFELAAAKKCDWAASARVNQ